VFGRDTVGDAVGQLSKVLSAWGYHGTEAHWESALCHLLLANRSPFPHDLTSDFLQEVRAGGLVGRRLDGYVHGLHRALAELGYVDPPPAPAFTPGPAVISGAQEAWTELVERWCSTSTLTPKVRSSTRAVPGKAGRWMAAEQPDAAGPADWSRQTCAWADEISEGRGRPRSARPPPSAVPGLLHAKSALAYLGGLRQRTAGLDGLARGRLNGEISQLHDAWPRWPPRS